MVACGGGGSGGGGGDDSGGGGGGGSGGGVDGGGGLVVGSCTECRGGGRWTGNGLYWQGGMMFSNIDTDATTRDVVAFMNIIKSFNPAWTSAWGRCDTCPLSLCCLCRGLSVVTMFGVV